jgi:hypothetical protein
LWISSLPAQKAGRSRRIEVRQRTRLLGPAVPATLYPIRPKELGKPASIPESCIALHMKDIGMKRIRNMQNIAHFVTNNIQLSAGFRISVFLNFAPKRDGRISVVSTRPDSGVVLADR